MGAKEIRVALVAAGVRVAGLLAERYPPPVVDGEPLFDYGKQVQHLIFGLETAEGEVVAAEDAHMKQEVKVSRLRTERDRKAGESYDKLIAVRQGFDGIHGAKGSFEAAFVSGSVPRSAKRLLGQLEQSITLLNDPAVALRTLKVAGFTVEYSAVASDLDAGRLDLQGTVDELDQELKLAEGTMLARRAAIDELRRTVIWAGRSAEGLFERAGESELASRIRTSTRRPLRPSEEPAADEPQADGPQAADIRLDIRMFTRLSVDIWANTGCLRVCRSTSGQTPDVHAFVGRHLGQHRVSALLCGRSAASTPAVDTPRARPAASTPAADAPARVAADRPRALNRIRRDFG